MKRLVVKLGGHALDDLSPDAPVLADLAADVGALRDQGASVLVVHGGGPQIGDLLARVGEESRFVDGLRVTDESTLSVVAMALGHVNVQLVAAFAHAQVDAVGLSGIDGGLLRCESVGAAWGRVGAVPAVRVALVEGLWSLGLVPITSSIGLDSSGRLLNVNADTAAGALAAALDVDALILLSDVDQVRTDPDDPATALATLDRRAAESLLASGRAREGMRPKIRAALDALDGGATRVTLASGARRHALRDVLDGSAPATEVTS